MELIFFFYIWVFLFGLATGSFLNSIIYRLKTGESFLFKRSYCPYCKHKLNWQDLIPIFSFITLKGKCRYCKKLISLQYSLVELVTAILFVLIFKLTISNQQLTSFSILNTCFLFLVSCFLIVIFVYDLKHYIIPDKIIYPAIGITFLYNIFYSYFILNTLYSAFGAAIFFLAIVLISKGRWMGVGDVKLVLFMGLFLGFPSILVALFFAFFLGAIIGIGLILTGKKTLKSEVPFGPFLVTGTFIALFLGNQIINCYLNLLDLTI